MTLSRRNLLQGAAAAALLPYPARAWFPRGTTSIPTGWNTLPLGAGGQVWGFHIANDGSMVCRGDVLGAYVWSGTSALSSITDASQKWRQVCTFAGFGKTTPGDSSGYLLADPWEYVQAPGNSNYHYFVTGDIDGNSRYYLYYSTDKGTTFTKMNVYFTPFGNYDYQHQAGSYKVAADPNNEKIVYWGMPMNSSNSNSVYTTFDRTSGHTWPTLNGATTDGSTVFPQPVAGTVTGVCGITFDTSMGTTTIGGEIVTKRVIIAVGGVGIYETTDGGVNWTNVAPAGYTSSAYVYQAFLDGDTNANSVKNYFCTFGGINKLYRYVGGGSGGWTNITPSGYAPTNLIVDPRASNVGYVTCYGPNGIAIGFTSTNATAATPTWGGGTGGQTPTFAAASYDIQYMRYLFGQGNFTNGSVGLIDANGTCLWCGNQSIWYFSAIPNWGVSKASTSNSFGRGQESTVAGDVLRPPGASYPILACQDVGAPLIGNTYTAYPNDMADHSRESTCQSLEYAASDPTFIVARMTGQQLDPVSDYSSYSTNSGASYTPIAGTPVSLWQAAVTGSVSGGILTVSSFDSGTFVFEGALVYTLGGSYVGQIATYGTGGTSGTGGTGTYSIGGSSAATQFNIVNAQMAGQTVAVDHDHWVTVPQGGYSPHFIPAYTTNATGAATWQLCQQSGGGNMPSANYMVKPTWAYGGTSRPIAVGYGADLGTVWIAQYTPGTGAITLWRSTDSGATYTSIGSTTGYAAAGAIYLLSVPSYTNELWLGLNGNAGSTGLWRITNANTASATFTSIAAPTSPSPARPLLHSLTLGAPASPGGYPLFYGTFMQSGVGLVPDWLYQGSWNGTSISWSLYGPTGSHQDLPASMQVNGIGTIRGDWDVPGRIYVGNNGLGYAYYTP